MTQSNADAVVCPERMTRWFVSATESNASDVHLVPGAPAMLRVHGRLQTIEDEPLRAAELREMLLAVCPDASRNRLNQDLNVDFSLKALVGPAQQRFRANYFVTGQEVAACFRLIPQDIPTLEWARFPADVAERIAHFRNGLVVVSGVTGSGKSTTLAMILNLLNAEGNHRIVTIEEPVEYEFPSLPQSLVTQREVGLDVHSFADGLKSSLRQDPDVILVGEIRDYETAKMAVTAAETGLLVFTTLHARDAKGVISRFTDLYPIDSQNEIRSQLAGSLRAVVCQHLLPPVMAGDRRKLAVEVMFNTGPIASGIRTGKLSSLDNNILTGRHEGMIPLDESVKQLLRSGEIDRETAARFASDPSVLSH